MRKNVKKLLLTSFLLLSLGLLVACGTAQEVYDTEPPQLSQLSADYYNQLGITDEVRQNTSAVYVSCPTADGGELQLRLPDYWEKLYNLGTEIAHDQTIIYLSDQYNAEVACKGGDLWSINVLTYEEYTERFDPEFMPQLPEAYSQILGANSAIIGTDDEHIYLISLPTDARFDYEDELATDLYHTSMQAQRKIVTDFLEINHITVNEEAPELN